MVTMPLVEKSAEQPRPSSVPDPEVRTEGWPATYCCRGDVVSTPPIVAPLLI